jgi:hypothetical protein
MSSLPATVSAAGFVTVLKIRNGFVGTVMPNVEHRSHKGLNNRAENSHVPIRKRKRVKQGFRSWSRLQRLVPIFSAVRTLFVPSYAQRSAFVVRLHRLTAMAEWRPAVYAKSPVVPVTPTAFNCIPCSAPKTFI